MPSVYLIMWQDPLDTAAPARLTSPSPSLLRRLMSDGKTEEQAMPACLLRHIERGHVPSNAVVVKRSAVPSDREFRNAWEVHDKQVRVNIGKARVIHMSRIRSVRDQELAKLDVAFIKAIERDDAAEKARLAAQRQTLRDIPQTFDLEGAKTPGQLKALWPDGLPS